MYSTTLYFIALSYMFCPTHEDFLGRLRNYYSRRFDAYPDIHISRKLRQLGIFDQWGVSYMPIVGPMHECNVTFWNGKVLKTGFIVSAEYLSQRPNITWPTEENHYYTLYIGDLDGKLSLGKNHSDYTKFQANCIWLRSNIPGCDIQRGNDLFYYWPPEKNREEEIRRHLILVFDQQHTEPLDFEGFEKSEQRKDFRVDKFAESFYFGATWAANLYLVMDDEQYIDGY